MTDDSRIDKIEAWLQGKLPATEAAAFQSEIAADPALADEVELHRLALQAGKHLSEQHLRQNVLMWMNSAKMDRPARFPYRNILWAVVALLLLTAVIFTYFHQFKIREIEEREHREIALRDSLNAFWQTQIQHQQAAWSAEGAVKDSLTQLEIKRLREELDRRNQAPHKQKNDPNTANRKIAFTYDYPSKFANTVRSASKNDSDSVITIAAKAFDAGHYSKAESLLKSIPPDDPRQDEVAKILPYALFYNEKFGEAAAAFAELKQRDRFEAQKAEWYILLCYVAEGRKAYAQKTLAEILSNPKHQFYEDAQNLKSMLENR